MQRTSRAPAAVASSDADHNVVRLQRRNSAATDDRAALSAEDLETLGALMERASNAARQMRYFALAIRRSSFSELISSAGRAGFTQVDGHPQRKEALFRWSAGEPDLIFSVSFGDPAKASVVAVSRGDISGLILTALSQAPTISVEANPCIENRELGRNAVLFRDMLLTFSDFDEMPAWTKYPERLAANAGAFARFRVGGLFAISGIVHAWESFSSRLFGARTILRRWLESLAVSLEPFASRLSASRKPERRK
jgi:hypothetical protein